MLSIFIPKIHSIFLIFRTNLQVLDFFEKPILTIDYKDIKNRLENLLFNLVTFNPF